eukprot:CAMPEP_0174887380 /NCGR_PEP_ID=MMETSP0167-20121228/2616_1 /TAXON_ID=38298 /ORGANISM="Rhodella maculata, Strain CCMP736" /LENGTH=68 /DNA_ID=CAMNT_0016123821 /DNA_START=63 /DNA_END=265 /DNA_ORIENTATION=-
MTTKKIKSTSTRLAHARRSPPDPPASSRAQGPRRPPSRRALAAPRGPGLPGTSPVPPPGTAPACGTPS